MEALAEMKPVCLVLYDNILGLSIDSDLKSLLRFPGGNNMEGQSPPNHWEWKKTIGPLKDRAGRPGTWDYHNTDGLGLVEYMQWCEDLNLEPCEL